VKIKTITAYQLNLPFSSGPYICSGGRTEYGFDSLIIEIKTDTGLIGYGEMAPLGSWYSAAFAAGGRAAVPGMSSALVGEDPRLLMRINRIMDARLKGHPYTKSAFDMACCDIASAAAELPLAEYLGDRDGKSCELYRSVPQGTPDNMAKQAADYVHQGYRRLQVKVGGDPDHDIERINAVIDAVPRGTTIFCDANGGWSTFEAKRFIGGTQLLDYVLEQPCESYEECREVRSRFNKPFVLDESVVSIRDLLQVHKHRSADAITLKIARSGGVTATRRMRDLAVDLGLLVTIEDTGGAQIATAAIAHLSLSTPATARLHTVDFHNWVTVSNALNAPIVADGRMEAPTTPGLGLQVDALRLGKPIYRTI
jgi:cis-L-3-hydroxyproline dehydratase